MMATPTFKSLQVLRTKVATRVKDFRLGVGTRIVVVNFKDGVITARVADPAKEKAKGVRLTLKPTEVETTQRGRPRKEDATA